MKSVRASFVYDGDGGRVYQIAPPGSPPTWVGARSQALEVGWRLLGAPGEQPPDGRGPAQ